MSTIVKVEKLSKDERYELRECIRTIKVAAYELGEAASALRHIRDNRLYRESHRTFEAFCNETFRYTRQHVNRVIGFGETIATIQMGITSDKVDDRIAKDKSAQRPAFGTNGSKTPINECQTRPLGSLPAADRPAAWAKAVALAGGEQPTGAQVALAVREIRGEAALAPATDLAWVTPTLARISRLSPEKPNEKAALELISTEVQRRLSPVNKT